MTATQFYKWAIHLQQSNSDPKKLQSEGLKVPEPEINSLVKWIIFFAVLVSNVILHDQDRAVREKDAGEISPRIASPSSFSASIHNCDAFPKQHD